MSDNRDLDLENMTGVMALHAASAEEERAFLASIGDAEQARYELVELSDTAVQLGLSVREEQPSAELGQRILALVAQTPQLPPTNDVRTLPHRVPRRRRRVTATLIAAVALVAAAIVGVVVVQANPGIGTSYQQIAQAADAEHGKATVTDGGTVTATWSDELSASAVKLSGVSEPGEGRAYELWYVSPDGTAKSAGLIPTHAGDWVTLDGTMAHGSAIAITIEPSGGSTQPTSTPIAVIPTGV
jgi:anti-sigma-K factor RskA